MLNYPNYVYEAWHGTLLMIAISLFAVFFNTVLARKLPLIEGMILVMHLCAFIGIVVTLWVLAPQSSAASVFSSSGFTDAGWHSLGGSTLVGITAGILPLVGADAAVHMSEGKLEVPRPPKLIATPTPITAPQSRIRTVLTSRMRVELQDASATLPKCMIWSTVFNGALGWIMVITLCFCLGDLDAALATPTGYPFIEIFYNATGSIAATTAMASFVLF